MIISQPWIIKSEDTNDYGDADYGDADSLSMAGLSVEVPWVDKRMDMLVGMVMGRVKIACRRREVMDGHINGKDRRLGNSGKKSKLLLYN